VFEWLHQKQQRVAVGTRKRSGHQVAPAADRSVPRPPPLLRRSRRRCCAAAAVAASAAVCRQGGSV